MIARLQNLRRPSLLQLLIFAAVVHLILTTSVFAIGRLGILPGISKTGCVTALSPDCTSYLDQANFLSDVLARSPLESLGSSAHFHLKLYSLGLVVLKPVLGVNILSAEPINLFCFIAILWLTFKLGEEVFDRQSGLLAAVAVAVWPSWLLHTTQILKDQVFIAVLLTLALIIACWLTRAFSWRLGLTTGIAGGAAAYIVSLTRSGFWGAIVLAIALIGTGLLLVRQIRGRRILIWNLLSAILIVCATTTILFSAPEQLHAGPPVFETPLTGPAVASGTDHPPRCSLKARTDYFALRLSLVRKGFVDLNKNSGSDIDAHVQFATALDVGWYLPRAIAIGFLAPFPNQWFRRGFVAGLPGRLLSGVEMSAFYAAEILALIGLWRARSNLGAWLLFFVSFLGVVVLSLAVINLGALYRFRYGFFILLLILAARGLINLVTSGRHERTKTGAAMQHLSGEQTV